MKFNTPRNVDVSVLSNFYPTLIQYASVSRLLVTYWGVKILIKWQMATCQRQKSNLLLPF